MTWTSQKGKFYLMTQQLDLREAGGVIIRATFLMTSTDAATKAATDTVSGISLDEFNGAGMVRKLLGGKDVTRVDGSLLVKFTHTALTWTSLGGGIRSIAGILYYIDPAGANNDATNIPLHYETQGFPKQASGLDFVYNHGTNGAFYL